MLRSLTMYRLLCGIYWIGLGVWLGSLVMLAASAPIVFQTVRSHQVQLLDERYAEAGMQSLHAGILAGGVVGNLIAAMLTIHLLCAVLVIISSAGQMAFFSSWWPGGWLGWRNLTRLICLVGAVALLSLQISVIVPAVHTQRSIMYDAKLAADTRAQAREVFQRYHKASEQLMGVAGLLVLATMAVSASLLHVREMGASGNC